MTPRPRSRPRPSGVRPFSPDARPQGDDGVTLIELTVTMTIMSVLLAMFTGAVLHMTRAANATQSVASAQSQITITHQRLDREVRYAAGISLPGTIGTNHYVEYLTGNTAVPTCTGLRLDTATGRLHYRTWQQGRTPGPWTVLASGVTSTAQPFSRIPDPRIPVPADSRFPFQRLQLRITAGGGKANTDVTFTALNTSHDSKTDTVCTEGRTTP